MQLDPNIIKNIVILVMSAATFFQSFAALPVKYTVVPSSTNSGSKEISSVTPGAQPADNSSSTPVVITVQDKQNDQTATPSPIISEAAIPSQIPSSLPSEIPTTTPAPSSTLSSTIPTQILQSSTSLTFPVRGIFYYPWFPQTWSQDGITPFTHYNPTNGLYSSSDTAIIANHIKAMQYAGMQVGIFEWSGQNTFIDQRVPLLLQAGAGTGFHWAAYYNQEGLSVGFGPNPSPAQITGDLKYIVQNYGSDPSYARINGKPLVFVYGEPGDDCGVADRWKEANTGINAYIVLKVFPGFDKCGNQPDGWHQYAPAVREDNHQGYSFVISSGFWKAGEDAPRLARDPNAFSQNVRDMAASNAPFQLVTTFNEWGEGSAIESAKEWESPSGFGIYLDTLHNILGGSGK